MNILILNGCIRGEASRTYRLLHAFLKEMQTSLPKNCTCTQLDLADLPLRPLTGTFFEEREQLLSENNRSHPRFDYAHQFAEADRIILAAPFWDLSIPAIVKIYIENISLDSITFGCNEEGMYGMCKAKDLLFLTTRGGIYSGTPLEQSARYIEALCSMFGIRKFRCIVAEGMDFFPEKESSIMAKAIEEAKEAGRQYFTP